MLMRVKPSLVPATNTGPCRWRDMTDSARNTRNTRRILHRGASNTSHKNNFAYWKCHKAESACQPISTNWLRSLTINRSKAQASTSCGRFVTKIDTVVVSPRAEQLGAVMVINTAPILQCHAHATKAVVEFRTFKVCKLQLKLIA